MQHHPTSDSALAPEFGALLAGVLNEIDYGVILVDAGGSVVHANHPAHCQLRDGHPLTMHADGWIGAVTPRDTDQLHQALRRAAQRQLRSLLSLGDEAMPAAVAVVPIGDTLAALVLGRTTACEPLSLAFYAREHALTSAETRVLAALSSGLSPREIARRQGVKLSTVRTQIAAIRDKTGVGGITALVRQVASLPPMVSRLQH